MPRAAPSLPVPSPHGPSRPASSRSTAGAARHPGPELGLLDALRVALPVALRGRGRARRRAEATVLAAVAGSPARAIPAVLEARDELRRAGGSPSALQARVDALLRSAAARSRRRAPPEAARGAGRGGAVRRSPAPDAGRGAAGAASPEGTGLLLRHLLALAPDGILTVRASGRVGLWNRAGRALTGRRRRDLQREGVRSLFGDPADFDAVLADLAGRGTADPRETTLRGAGGEEIPVRLLGAALPPPAGAAPAAPRALPAAGSPPAALDRDPAKVLLVLHDLREVHTIRRRLIETEKLSAMAKIAASVAHEFRNPLNSLFLSADLLEDELSGREEVVEAIAPPLAAIREEVERLNQIINHYLALSKVESREPEVLDLALAVTAFAEEWRERAARLGLELRVRAAPGDVRVSADPDQVRRVLVNLVENAFDVLSAGDGEGRSAPRGTAVTLSVRPMRRTVRLVVRDDGPGLPVEVRRRLFEPFVTSKPRGSGLGLYLVREIVLAHGGAIALSGQGGRGTAVVMHWPRAEGAPS